MTDKSCAPHLELIAEEHGISGVHQQPVYDCAEVSFAGSEIKLYHGRREFRIKDCTVPV
jgi:hypothetical protein